MYRLKKILEFWQKYGLEATLDGVYLIRKAAKARTIED